MDTLLVPAYGEGDVRVSGPHLVYRAGARSSSAALPDLILNPRHSVEYGGESPRIYVELYGVPETPVEVSVRDDDGLLVWSGERDVVLGDEGLRYLILDVPSSALPLGRLAVTVTPRDMAPDSATLLVGVSDQWVVANFEELLDFVAYIASEAEMDSLRNAQGEERQRLWDQFWARRDPLPATPVNEFRETFFERVRLAAQQFREPGTQGWQTDRGEVFIVLGPPSTSLDIEPDQREPGGRGSAVQWIYDAAPGGRLTLVFVDQTGFGRYELTPNSRSAFRSAAERLRPRD